MVAKKKAEPGPDKPMTIRFPREVRLRLKGYAARADRPIQEVATEAVDEYLKKRGA